MQKRSPTRWPFNFLNLYWMIKPEIMVSPKDHSITLQEKKKKKRVHSVTSIFIGLKQRR